MVLLFIITSLLSQEKKPRYERHTEIRPDGTVVQYIIDRSPEVKAKIDSQWGPIQGYPTTYYGN